MAATISKVLLAGAAIALSVHGSTAEAQQTTPGVPATSGGPGVRTTTGPRPGSRLPPAPPAASRPSSPRPNNSPAYNPNGTLEQRQDQLRAMVTSNPGDRYTPYNVGQALDVSSLSSDGYGVRGGFVRSFSFAASSLAFSRGTPLQSVADSSFQPRTVNDFIYALEYLENDWLCGGSRTLTEGGNRMMGGFLAEPFEPSSVFPGVNPAVFAQMSQTPPTDVPPAPADLGDEAMMAGRSVDAVDAYKLHLDSAPGDAPVMVRMAVAMIESGKAAEGSALLMKAYRDDPTVAGVSLRPMTESWEPSRTRALVTKAVTHANRERSASAWATVAVLMVADGRAGLASQMLDRSIAAGLDSDLGTRLSAMIADAQK